MDSGKVDINIAAGLLVALEDMKRCPGYWTTDQETGETFAHAAESAISYARGNAKFATGRAKTVPVRSEAEERERFALQYGKRGERGTFAMWDLKFNVWLAAKNDSGEQGGGNG